MEKQRIVYFDFLRIIAALSIMLAHIVIYYNNLIGKYYYSFYLYKDITGYSIPIFVMISGAIFLNPAKKINIDNILKKYIPRIMIVFFYLVIFLCVFRLHS